MKVPKLPERKTPPGKHKPVTRTVREKSSRTEKKYERLTGRNPRKGT